MGTLIYGHALQLEVDDRTLQHVGHVVFAKLRKQEAFPLVCVSRDSGESVSLWISRDISVGFRVSQPEGGELCGELVTEFMRLASTARGLVIETE